MTKGRAEQVLRDRKKRVAVKRGKPASDFTVNECLAVRALAAAGRTQRQIANMAGMALRTFHRATERQETLLEAWQLGVDDRRTQQIDRLEKHAKQPKDPKQLKAIEMLLRLDGGMATDGKRAGAAGGVNVNLNFATAGAIDGRTYSSILKKVRKKDPNMIEGTATAEAEKPHIERDPIQALKDRQEKER